MNKKSRGRRRRNVVPRVKTPPEPTEEKTEVPAPARKEEEENDTLSWGENVLVAIDLANLYCQVKMFHDEKRVKGDYSTLKESILGTDFDGQAMMMCFAPIPNPSEDIRGYNQTNNLHNMIRHLGYIVHTTERRNGKADVDVPLTVNVMSACQRKKPDDFVLVSADGDFESLLRKLREDGIRVTVASIQSNVSTKLQLNCDRTVDLTDWASVPIDERGRKADGSRHPTTMDPAMLKPINDIVYEIRKVKGDSNRKRLKMKLMPQAFLDSMKKMAANELKVHRGILSTLRDCIEMLNPDDFNNAEIEYVMTILEVLKEERVDVEINTDIRNRLLNSDSA